MAKEKSQQNNTGKLPKLWPYLVKLHAEHPEAFRDPDLLKATVSQAWTALKDPTRCANCNASMAEYADILDINDALLLFSMAKIIRHRQTKGISFTDANKIRVSSEDIHHTQKCRTTKCSKLGLIAKAGNASWSITTRGWQALAGQPVPRVRVTFRGEILERPEELTTFAEVFREHGDKMRERQARGKSLKEDKRSSFADYDQSEWVHIAGTNQGALL